MAPSSDAFMCDVDVWDLVGFHLVKRRMASGLTRIADARSCFPLELQYKRGAEESAWNAICKASLYP